MSTREERNLRAAALRYKNNNGNKIPMTEAIKAVLAQRNEVVSS